MEMKQDRLNARESRNDFHATPIVPPVDIVEDKDGITVRADLPGVSKETLSIGVDGDTLTLEGTVALEAAADLKSVYAEIRTPQYKRSFVLSRDLDTEQVSASLAHGVLTLRVPKREQAKPRRIEVKA
jgi:HSP20 family molecular chaperone IbpA